MQLFIFLGISNCLSFFLLTKEWWAFSISSSLSSLSVMIPVAWSSSPLPQRHPPGTLHPPAPVWSGCSLGLLYSSQPGTSLRCPPGLDPLFPGSHVLLFLGFLPYFDGVHYQVISLTMGTWEVYTFWVFACLKMSVFCPYTCLMVSLNVEF